ncbi:MAG: M20/M25/M40 family metallo-hydrolase [Solirubrobacterales bacterium]|nr:M20/M25/M40 family metallo-hydrolase [Solirubrobacterales bacterium]MBV9941035.1 M20/M25/M40 family metallo-hydrolase [Solirubrobacterales bacterium]
MRRASDAERERLHETFAALCRIESPSGRERACADWVAGELRRMGLEVDEDDAGPRVGSNAGNLLARIEGAGRDTILLCAHLDTVPLTAPVEPVRLDDGWENANDGILGADNKSAVAVIVELARRLTEAGAGPPPVGLELLFTVCEEVSLLGALAFDVTRLRSRFGYVFDHATPIGEIVIAAPTLHRIVGEFRGRAAHAGVRPEHGRSAIAAAARAIAAMRLGRLDSETTANVGTIRGGTAINVVPERCRVEAEARSVDRGRVEALATEMIDHLQDAADAAECDLDVTVERMIEGYRMRPRAIQVTVAEQALLACGYEPRHILTGGASDANAFHAAGLPCTNLADGTEHNHEPTERISTTALEGLLEVAIALVDEAGKALAGETAP